MEFISVGQAYRDRIHVRYKGKIATFYGEMGEDYFAVLVNDIEWYPNHPATVEEKIELMIEANKTFHDKHRLYFYEDNAIFFDWRGMPFIYVMDGVIKAVEMPCICNALVEINGFDTNEEYEQFDRYIKDLLQVKALQEKKTIQTKKGHTQKNYQCKVCKCNWCLVKPDHSSKGLWRKQ